MFFMKMFENRLCLLRFFKRTRFPGKLLDQYFFGKLEVNIFWPIQVPDIYGLCEYDPFKCLFNVNSFFFVLNIDVITDILSSHIIGFVDSVIFLFNFLPLENTVTLPILFLPALFLENILKNLLN